MNNEDCLKLTTYFGERDRVDGRLLADELLDIYGGHRVATSILVRGAEGFGRLHHLHTDRLLSLSEDLPVMSIAVDRRDRIEAMLEPVLQVKQRGLITPGARAPAHRRDRSRRAARAAARGDQAHRLRRPPGARLRHARLRGRLRPALPPRDRRRDRAARRRRNAARPPQRARFFGRNAEVPMMIIAVGGGEAISRVLPELGGLLHDPLLTLERVRVCKRDGELLARPHELPAHRPARAWHVAEAHGLLLPERDRPRPAAALEIIRRLRESGASRRHQPARDLGVSRRPRSPRRPVLPDAPPRSGTGHVRSTRPSRQPRHSPSSTSSPPNRALSPVRWSPP